MLLFDHFVTEGYPCFDITQSAMNATGNAHGTLYLREDAADKKLDLKTYSFMHLVKSSRVT